MKIDFPERGVTKPSEEDFDALLTSLYDVQSMLYYIN